MFILGEKREMLISILSRVSVLGFCCAATLMMVYCQDKTINTEELIDRVIVAHGAEKFSDIHLEFTFRDFDYILHRTVEETIFIRESNNSDSLKIRDVYPLNNGLQRYINEQITQQTDSLVQLFQSSLNSVMYFVQLPFKLKDPAVITESIDQQTIKEQIYNVIKVTFEQQGGGEDFQDEYRYWIHPENYTMDYLAYSFNVDEGGIRFRKAIKRREINGIVFQDYENYRPVNDEATLDSLAALFSNGDLELVSLIEKTNITTVP